MMMIGLALPDSDGYHSEYDSKRVLRRAEPDRMHRDAACAMDAALPAYDHALSHRQHSGSWCGRTGDEGTCLGVETMKVHRISRYPARSPEEAALRSAYQRCTNPKNERFHRYGGRGIRVCDEWCEGEGMMVGVLRFMEHIGPRPSPAHSLDRIDNDGHYEPGNVRWATAAEQASNRINHWAEKRRIQDEERLRA